MKRLLFLIMVLLTLRACESRGMAAPSVVDPTLVPFKAGELQQQLVANQNNAQALILLLLRADEMSSSRFNPKFSRINTNSYNIQALRKLEQMHRDLPNNMKVLSAYCFALDIKNQGTHHQFTSYAPWSSDKEQQVQAMLKEIYRKAPNLWVPYAIEGYRLFYRGGEEGASLDRGIKLLKKAVELAPQVPLIRSRYARIYAYAADWQHKEQKDKAIAYGIAVAQCEKAVQFRPSSSEAAYELFQSYVYGWTSTLTSDKAKAKFAAQRFLSTLPPGYVFADYEQRALSRVGIKVSSPMQESD